MDDFSLISHKINFNFGPRVDIWDDRNPYYLIEFYERIQNGWALVSTVEEIYPFNYFQYIAIRFRNNWMVKIWSWENSEPTLLVQHTYNEKNQNILLNFDSDIFNEHIIWYNLTKKYQSDFMCNVSIVSKFSDKLKNLFIDNKIEIYSEAPNKEYYGTYNIGRYDIITSPTRQWGSGLASPNQGRHFVSPNHPKNWMQLDTEEIFNDIMNL